MTTSTEQEKPRSAMELALRRALSKRETPTKAKAPAILVGPKAAHAKLPTKPRSVAQLTAHILAEDKAGRLDLRKPAVMLATMFGTDVAFLSSGMMAAGFVRIRRGVLGELHFRRKK